MGLLNGYTAHVSRLQLCFRYVGCAWNGDIAIAEIVLMKELHIRTCSVRESESATNDHR